MPGMKIFTSNRMEILVKELAQEVKKPLSPPLQKEIVVVQSRGMERWVSLELARLLGICANFEFSLLKKFIRDTFQKFIPGLPFDSPFDPPVMTWAIMKLLPNCIEKKGFESLADYLMEDSNLKSYQLSTLIADTFDQYTIFRPEMLLEWEQGAGEHWQAQLWRELVQGRESFHNAALWNNFLNKTTKSSTPPEGYYERISVFGVSAFPPFHLNILSALSKWTDVHFFILNPCREYWTDIVSNQEWKRIAEKDSETLSADNLHLNQGNAILASMGLYGRDFLSLVQEWDVEEHCNFVESEANHMLSSVQSDILSLRDRGKSEDEEKTLMDRKDRSIQIHSCHSPLREMEILHDNLLAMFDEDPSLTPGELLVMTPDIELYSPFIHAVFGTTREESLRIPYSISDRNMGKSSRIADPFLAILELPDSRFGAIQVLSLLESIPLRKKFGFSMSDLEVVKKWVEKNRIRWGIDEDDREKMDIPPTRENSWKAGLERLLLGYAMAGGEEKVFHGILPYDDMEGAETSILGNLVGFLEQLFLYSDLLKRKRPLYQWVKFLEELLDRFFMEDEDSEKDIQFIQGLLSDLRKSQEIAGFDEEVDIVVVKSYLKGRLEREISSFGFLTGKVTFCAMLPMRSIPFRVICLAGMNGDAFPRVTRAHGFDLMAKSPRKGDRSLGKEDRYIFLEAVISARKLLYISYVGQNIKDNTESPPSILVNELLDYLEQGFRHPSGSISEHVVSQHKLQSFNPAYFRESDTVFSYSRENLEASLHLNRTMENPGPFIHHGISAPADDWKNLDLDQLCGFFMNPAKFLLNRRLGISLEEKSLNIHEKEPFSLEGLEKYSLSTDLVGKGLDGESLNDYLPLVKAQGILPHGTVGRQEFEKMKEKIDPLADVIGQYRHGAPKEPLLLDVEISGFRITGRIDNIFATGLLSYRPTRIKPKDRIKVWIYHLLLNMVAPADYPRKSIFVGEDVVLGFAPVENSEEFLEQLLRKYWEGLSKPLRFFPGSSWSYTESLIKKKKSEGESLEKARQNWFGKEFQGSLPPEGEDPYFGLCFGKIDPLDSLFQEVAVEIFGPLLECGEETKIT